jgi:biotin-(acetyl-CoA carboxylase) ligase
MGPLHVRLAGEVRSTQDELWAKRRWAEEGAGIAAVSQTAGAGRGGASWISPEGGVYLSVLAGRGLPAEDADVLGEAAALAVLRAAEEFLKVDDLFLKWPNDVVTWGPSRRMGKLAGVLVRTEIESGRVAQGVVGIGVNVREGVERAALGTPGVAAMSLEGLSRRRGVAWNAPRTKVLEWVVGWFGVLLARAREDPSAVRKEFSREVARAPLRARVAGVKEELKPLGVERGGVLAVRRLSGRRATVSVPDAERLKWTILPRPKEPQAPRRRGDGPAPRKASARAGARPSARPRSSRARSARRASRSR